MGPPTSLSVPSYGEIEAIALDLLDLIAGGAFKQLWVIYNAPVRRFQYTFVPGGCSRWTWHRAGRARLG